MKQTDQSGRSIVEMLGVLALIGVFSYGGVLVLQDAITTLRAKYIAEQVRLRVDEATSVAELSKGHKKQVYTPEYINKTDAGSYGYSFTTTNIEMKKNSVQYYLEREEYKGAKSVEVVVNGTISPTVCKKVLARMELSGIIQKVDGKTLAEFTCASDNVESLTLEVGKNDKYHISSSGSTPTGGGSSGGSTTTCGSKKYSSGGICFDCPTGAIACRSSTDYDCPSDYYKVGYCKKCPDYSSTTVGDSSQQVSTTGCYCATGYTPSGMLCVVATTGTPYKKGILQGYHWNGNATQSLYSTVDTPKADSVVCPSGYHWAGYDEMRTLTHSQVNDIYTDSAVCDNCSDPIYLLKNCYGTCTASGYVWGMRKNATPDFDPRNRDYGTLYAICKKN